MAKGITEQMPITIAGFDVACDVESGELMQGRRPAVDLTGLCTSWDEFASPNLRHWSVRLGYFINFDASSSGSSTVAGINIALQAVMDSTATSGVALLIRKTTSARSATNPEWSGNVQIDGDYTVVGGAVAQASKGSVVLKGLGILTRITSSS